MALVIQISRSPIPRRPWVKQNHFNGLEDVFKFIYFSQKQLGQSLGRSIVAQIFGIKQLDTDGLLLLVPIIGPISHQVNNDSRSNHWLRKVCLKYRRHGRVSHVLSHVVGKQPQAGGF